MTTYPNSEDGWRRRILDAPPVMINGKQVRLDPDELLNMQMVAAELTRIRNRAKPYSVDTVRSRKQIGDLPVPPIQVGGRDPEPGETIPVNGQYQRTPGRTLRKFREPRPGEKIGGPGHPMTVAWPRWMIWQWNASRRGPGNAMPGRVGGRPRKRREETAGK